LQVISQGSRREKIGREDNNMYIASLTNPTCNVKKIIFTKGNVEEIQCSNYKKESIMKV